MAASKVSDTRLFPGKPITAQIIQEFDTTQNHIATRPQDAASDTIARGRNSMVAPYLDKGFYPVAETDFQFGHFHTSGTTSTLFGSIIDIFPGNYDINSFIKYSNTSGDIYCSVGLYQVDDNGNKVGFGDFPEYDISENIGNHINGGKHTNRRFSYCNDNNNTGLRVCYLSGKFRLGLFTLSQQTGTRQASGYVQICQRKEVSTCPISCERGFMDDDTGDFEISSSDIGSLTSTESMMKTLEPMKIYWS
tara:strand:+ start:5046 stop:5792 length:747 start_codon:yes stop_codon:yes gene_type:complete